MNSRSTCIVGVAVALTLLSAWRSGAANAEHQWLQAPITLQNLTANAEFVPVSTRVDFKTWLDDLRIYHEVLLRPLGSWSQGISGR